VVQGALGKEKPKYRRKLRSNKLPDRGGLGGVEGGGMKDRRSSYGSLNPYSLIENEPEGN